MRTRILASMAVMAVVMAVAPPMHARARVVDPIEDIRQALLWLPYYGPFDALSFRYEKGTVTLTGSAYALGLKADAERAVKRVAGVDTVVNLIEPLPASANDDDIRWRTFYAIYTSEFLSRYAPGGGLMLGRYDTRRERDLGLEPIGQYPIHIIVRHGRIQLMGVVSTTADKTVAGLAARGVPGAFDVENQLQVVSGT
ncbi:MAG: BON domain-containing protein [Acidobacteriota bacterium]|nr:BON domain-containing protein [Acidobacteriota bacterium]